MAIYILNTDNDARRGTIIEKRLRDNISNAIKIDRIEDVAGIAAPKGNELVHVVIIVPINDKTYVKQFINDAPLHVGSAFFIIVGDEISASEYKALVRSGRADWVSADADAVEILDIV